MKRTRWRQGSRWMIAALLGLATISGVAAQSDRNDEYDQEDGATAPAQRDGYRRGDRTPDGWRVDRRPGGRYRPTRYRDGGRGWGYGRRGPRWGYFPRPRRGYWHHPRWGGRWR
jgi:hypothetical protein